MTKHIKILRALRNGCEVYKPSINDAAAWAIREAKIDALDAAINALAFVAHADRALSQPKAPDSYAATMRELLSDLQPIDGVDVSEHIKQLGRAVSFAIAAPDHLAHFQFRVAMLAGALTKIIEVAAACSDDPNEMMECLDGIVAVADVALKTRQESPAEDPSHD